MDVFLHVLLTNNGSKTLILQKIKVKAYNFEEGGLCNDVIAP